MEQKGNDKIAAIATPIGKGAISCVRISGEGSAELVQKFTGVKKFVHGQMTPCTFCGRIRDRIMAVVYYAPKSYTGEESAELYFHGGRYLTEQALYGILDGGARLAEAGEFTRRAFLNGKIDLTQAEGISDLIDGDSLISLEAAYEQSEGSTAKEITYLYDKLTTVAAAAEVCIDYPEEDIEEQTREQLLSDLNEILAETDKQIAGFDGGRIKREGARVALTGKTNAGKSTLFNTLLKTERAIVSDEEGTTRDTIEEKILYKGMAFVLIDTAGIRETENRVEQMGIERSKTALREADIAIRILREEDKEEARQSDEKTITAVNFFRSVPPASKSDTIYLNAATGENTELLLEELYRRIKEKTQSGGKINNARQYEALKDAKENLLRAISAVQTLTMDCVCADLHGALAALGRIIGRNASESVIDEIFSRFCVGK